MEAARADPRHRASPGLQRSQQRVATGPFPGKDPQVNTGGALPQLPADEGVRSLDGPRRGGPCPRRCTLSRPDPRNSAPPAHTGMLVAAGVLLLVPIVALMWVSSYAQDEPRLGGWPFFFWYQFLWVFLCSGFTYAAYVVLRKPARTVRWTEPDERRGPPMSTLHRRRPDHRGQLRRADRPRSSCSLVVRDGVLGLALAPAAEHGEPGRVGPRRAQLRHLDHLVPARRRPLHGLHLRRRPCRDVRAGAVSGFFAVPYTIILYPIIFIFMSRLWSVSHRHGYVTPADFVAGRYGSRGLSLAVAITGFVATMPYIALQLVGIQAVLEVVGLGGPATSSPPDLPLFIAFLVLALYTYTSGLRAPALIAFVKDILIYLVIIVAIIYLPSQVRRLGGDLRCGREEDGDAQPDHRQADRRVHPRVRAVLGLRHAGPRVGDGAVHVPALDHRRARVQEPQHDPPQRRDPAGVQLRARPARPARLGRDRRRHQADRSRRQAQRPAGHPAAVRGLLPGAGSPASPSRPSRSARSCRPPSCRSRRPTRSRATSTRSGSTGRDRRAGGQGLQDRVRWWSRRSR